MSRCYVDRPDESCWGEARYEARLTWTEGVMHLCEDCAAAERERGDVLQIRSLYFGCPLHLDRTRPGPHTCFCGLAAIARPDAWRR